MDAVQDDGHLRLTVDHGERLIADIVMGLGVPITGVNLHQPTLEDVFVRLTGGALRDDDSKALDAFPRARGSAAAEVTRGGHHVRTDRARRQNRAAAFASPA